MFWTIFSRGDVVIQVTAALLILASIATWGLILYKFVVLSQFAKVAKAAPKAFWKGKTFEGGLKQLMVTDSSGVMADAVRQSVLSVRESGVAASVPLDDRLQRTLRMWLDGVQRRMDGGMTVLATITSAAPFVGLFGTVWGIYGALIGMGAGADAALLDKISGPIGEALIMTAVGLAVAIPSLVAYNMFARWTRLLRQDIEGFATDIHAYALHNAAQLATVEVK